jgi:hypothetical protein
MTAFGSSILAAMKIDSSAFDRVITVRDAYRALDHFLAAHLSRGETSTVDLATYAGLCADGRSGDPAALQDFLNALAEVESAPTPAFEVVIEDDISRADRMAVEVRLRLADGSERWCFFMTPSALAQCGDWIPGTKISMHFGELHMFVVGECTEETITRVLNAVAEAGELLRRTKPC